jgi:hypothetical protein
VICWVSYSTKKSIQHLKKCLFKIHGHPYYEIEAADEKDYQADHQEEK